MMNLKVTITLMSGQEIQLVNMVLKKAFNNICKVNGVENRWKLMPMEGLLKF